MSIAESALAQKTSVPHVNGQAPPDQASRCNGCKSNLEESNDSVVVAFGDRLWHINCFRCAKCRQPVEHDSNLLLLSDGSPVCTNCSYICCLCNKLIQHEAIVTGDESFHADCFRCKSCRKRIEELVFAKTSTGLWCLECHHARLARSRKHSEAKRNRARMADGATRSPLPLRETPRDTPLTSPTASPALPNGASAADAAPQPTDPSVSSYATARSAPPSPPPPSTTTYPSIPVTPVSRLPTSPQSTDQDFADGVAVSPRPFDADGLQSTPNGNAPAAGSLAPPSLSNRQSNRRSGFYGRPASQTSSEWHSQPDEEQIDVLDAPLHAIEPVSPSIAAPPVSADVSNSMSFYDVDMLAALNASPPKPASSASVTVPLRLDDRDVSELLDPLEAEESFDVVSDRLRDSIRQSRSMPAFSSAGAIDVDAVELLLGELVATKERMKELQGKYNEARRASLQVFEGINQAREEVEQEASARRDAETEMVRLKHQLREQALRLGQLDVIQQRAEALQRRSTELSSTVIGIERHLASLKAERDISVAEVEQLKRFSAGSTQGGEVEPETITVSLDSRLAEIKAQHRSELDELLHEKEALARELEEMKQTRDVFAAEAAILNTTNEELADSNQTLSRQIDQARSTLLRLQQQSVALTANGHHKSSSSTSRPILPQARSSPGSSFDISTDATALVSVQRIETSTSPAPRKFKWGKGKNEVVRSMGSASNLSTAAKPSKAPNTKLDTGHCLQQVSILRPQRCEACGEKMWGLQERCTLCPLVCHSRCSDQLNGLCPGAGTTESGSGPKGALMGRDLTERCGAEGASIPSFVTACIEAVEARGMDYEGIYRKSGGTGQVRLIESLFEADKAVDLSDDERFNDISAVTSALKNYFRNLPDCLFTAGLHESFVSAGALRNNDEGQLTSLAECIGRLPTHHLATLTYLMRHLQRVAQQSEDNKMTPVNLGVVFGPTLLRAGLVDELDGMKDLQHRNRVVELCVLHASRLFG